MLLAITLSLHFLSRPFETLQSSSAVSRGLDYIQTFLRAVEELCRRLIKSIVWPLKKYSNQRSDGWFVSAKLSFFPPTSSDTIFTDVHFC